MSQWRSRVVTEGLEERTTSRDAARRRLRRRGLREADRRRRERLQQHHALQRLDSMCSRRGPMDALKAAGAMPQVFGTITVSDGISMGTEGMKYSLVSREVIADSIETVVNGQSMDGVLAIGGCDKNMPGAMIAIARLDIPAIFVYGGTIKPGHLDGRDLTVVSVFEAVGQRAAGRIDDAQLRAIECAGLPRAPAPAAACSPPTRCPRRSRRWASSLPGSSTMAAEDAEKAESAAESARVLAAAVRADLLPRQILTRHAFENAIAVVMAIGGSTNAVLHLLAIAHAAEVPLALDDFEAIRARVPVLCDLKPSGRYVATDLHRAGGIPQVMKMLLAHGAVPRRCADDHRPDHRRGARERAAPSRRPARR